MIKFKTKQIIKMRDWDDLVIKTYGRRYNFQQQDGCKPRGIFYMTVPDEAQDYEKDTVSEKLYEDEMGVSFAAWLARDPKKGLPGVYGELFWDRHFYPEVQTVANDLYAKGLIPAGEYGIDIDW